MQFLAILQTRGCPIHCFIFPVLKQTVPRFYSSGENFVSRSAPVSARLSAEWRSWSSRSPYRKSTEFHRDVSGFYRTRAAWLADADRPAEAGEEGGGRKHCIEMSVIVGKSCVRYTARERERVPSIGFKAEARLPYIFQGKHCQARERGGNTKAHDER